jgi:membrane associated rhomboid family serine protease
MFVQTGLLHLIANAAGLVQVGSWTERLFGRFAIANACGAGLLAGVIIFCCIR